MGTAGRQAYSTLRAAILDGVWRPGERLAPGALGARLGTSTTVIREALTRLTAEDLVTLRPQRGFAVRDLDVQELHDLTELRCLTEAYAARLSLERGDVAWESSVMAAYHRLTRTPRRDPEGPAVTTAAWQEAHRAFHEALLSACGCEPVLRQASQLGRTTELYRRWASASPAASQRDVEGEHRGLLEAALAHDVEAMAARLRHHYEATAEMVLDSGVALASTGR
jgi:DNA-binding GntR family transcriptional regulator